MRRERNSEESNECTSVPSKSCSISSNETNRSYSLAKKVTFKNQFPCTSVNLLVGDNATIHVDIRMYMYMSARQFDFCGPLELDCEIAGNLSNRLSRSARCKAAYLSSSSDAHFHISNISKQLPRRVEYEKSDRVREGIEEWTIWYIALFYTVESRV